MQPLGNTELAYITLDLMSGLFATKSAFKKLNDLRGLISLGADVIEGDRKLKIIKKDIQESIGLQRWDSGASNLNFFCQEWASIQGGRLRAVAALAIRLTRRTTVARSA